jgi:2-polyprenyl-6-methoxyphenol hydroxylase-like FAD-dependent oxidoreductase
MLRVTTGPGAKRGAVNSGVLRVGCCIAGGGPAGMMLGYLLARAGIDVVVLEKHADFLRDFRGDTVHPSTLDVIAELGLLDAFLARPHQEVAKLTGLVMGHDVTLADFTHLRTRCKFIALTPQWEFLNFLAENGRRFPGFRVMMRAQVTELVRDGDVVVGVRATTQDGPVEIRAELVVGADGRHSTVRAAAGLSVRDLGAPIDVLWMQLSKYAEDPNSTLGRIVAGHVLVTIDRGNYWQCAFVIPKGGFDALRARGLQALRDDLVTIAPFLHDRVDELRTWDDVKLLVVTVDRLRRWHAPGLLCIGDAAHAMSPIGGVGINLAIQDAVATANLLAQPLRAHSVTERHLAAVERRRTFPVKVTQAIQVFVQDRIFSRVLRAGDAAVATPPTAPLAVRILRRLPFLQRIAGYVVGVGLRPEHVRTRPSTSSG